MLQLQALELALDLLKPLQFSDDLGLGLRKLSGDQAIANLLAPAREHEGVDAQGLSDVLDEHPGFVAQGDSLELELSRVAVDEFGARFCHGGHSPLG